MEFKRHDAKRGFTLIELLVVIGIIAVLIAILIPSLGRVREKAKITVCATHLRGWGQGFIMYCTDFNGRLPLDGGDGETGPAGSGQPIGVWSDPKLWFNGVTNYVSGTPAGYDQLQENAKNNGNSYDLPHGGTNSMFICPSIGDPDGAPGIDVMQNGFFMTTGYFAVTNAGPSAEVRPMLMCYGMNSQLRNWDYKHWQTYWTDSAEAGDVKSITQLTPAQIVPLVAEKRIRPDEISPSDRYFHNGLTQSKVTASRFTTRHDRGGNIVFADGHVDLMKYSTVTRNALKSNQYNIKGVIIWNPTLQ